MVSALRALYKTVNAYYLGYAYELAQHLRPARRREAPDGRFVLFARGRSGTTLLLSLLDRHPAVACDGEILRRRAWHPQELIKAHEALTAQPVYGFKLLSYQLRSLQTHRPNRRAMLEELVDNGFQVIYLRRRNLLRHALSGLYAEHRRHWHQTTAAASHERFSIDRSDLFRWLDGSTQLARFEQRMLEALPHLALTYEDDLEDAAVHARTLRRVTGWLGLDPIDPQTTLQRTTPRRLDAFVDNAAEMRRWVAASPYARFLPSTP